MSPVEIGVAGMVLLLVLLFVGLPVSFSFALAGVIGFSWVVSPDAAISVLSIEIFSNFASYSLSVIPMFLLMGAISFASGMSGRLFDAGYTVFGRTRGGLAIANIVACAAFSAVCGSTAATAAAMGKVALPEMKRYGYDDALATGCVASAGSLGILIPPSSTLIVYAMLTEQAVGKLFMAGIFPGLLLAACFIAAVVVRCWQKPSLAPGGPSTTFKQKILAFSGIIEMLILFCLVMGGLFTGWFTPTQAGSAGTAGALLIALARRRITWQGLLGAFKDTMLISCMVMVIIAGALVFSRFLAVSEIPFLLSDWVIGLPISPMAIMLIIVAFHFVAGTFMDGFGLILLTVPVLFPTIIALGFDPIWYGIVIILIVEMGCISPPHGLNMWVVKGIAPDIPVQTIFKGVVPFIFALIACTALLMFFPQIATFLPGLMRY